MGFFSSELPDETGASIAAAATMTSGMFCCRGALTKGIGCFFARRGGEAEGDCWFFFSWGGKKSWMKREEEEEKKGGFMLRLWCTCTGSWRERRIARDKA